MRRLRPLRISLELIFFILILVGFTDFREFIPRIFLGSFLEWQFVPALLKTLMWSVGGLLALFCLIGITLLGGRVYCSTLCPLGVFQDIISRLKKWVVHLIRKKNKKKQFKFSYTKPQNYLRYTVLVLAFLPLMAGSAYALAWLDPYSIFGRIATYILYPFVVSANNGLAVVSEWFKSYAIYRTSVSWNGVGFGLALFFFLVVGGLAFWRGRLFCNIICPVGTLLGLLSLRSRYRLVQDTDGCTHCNRCVKACKAECINEKIEIDMSRCVMCYNCLTACSTMGIVLKRHSKKAPPAPPADHSKRDFVRRVGIAAFSFTLLGKVLKGAALDTEPKASDISLLTPNPSMSAVTPPGAISMNNLHQKCTSCSLCINVCPPKVLQPSVTEYGFSGFLQPYMDFTKNFCNYTCKECIDVCPTDALKPLSMEEKKVVRIGVSRFVTENCVIEIDGTECGACTEHCPTKAVDMTYEIRPGVFLPHITEDLCIGCGGCEYPCPQPHGYKAIYVEALSVHETAAPPPMEPQEKPKEEKVEEFPF